MYQSGELVDISEVVTDIHDIDPADAAASREFAEFPAHGAAAASETLMATDPSITEALEATYVQWHAQETLSPDIEPVDYALAVGGLKKVKESPGITGGFRAAVSDALKHARCVVDNQASAVSSNSATAEAIATPEEDVPKENIFQKGIRRIVDQGHRHITGEHGVRKSAVDRMLSLSEHFVIDGKGNPCVLNHRKYTAAWAAFAQDVLRVPEHLKDFYHATTLIGGSALREPRSYSRAVTVFTGKLLNDARSFISSTPMELANISGYQHELFDMLSELPSGRQYSYVDDFNAQPLSEIPEEGYDQLKVSKGHHEHHDRIMTIVTADIMAQAMIMNIVLAARSKPNEAFDAIYAFARAGFDPTHKTKFEFTSKFIVDAAMQSEDLREVFDAQGPRRSLEHYARLVDLNDVMTDSLGKEVNKQLGVVDYFGQSDESILMESHLTIEKLISRGTITEADAEEITALKQQMDEDGESISSQVERYGNPLAAAA